MGAFLWNGWQDIILLLEQQMAFNSYTQRKMQGKKNPAYTLSSLVKSIAPATIMMHNHTGNKIEQIYFIHWKIKC